jgi:hypothetical protein
VATAPLRSGQDLLEEQADSLDDFARGALEERAREQAKSKDEPEEKAKPEAKMQYNFTDPESRILPGADGFVQAYNAQIAVEPRISNG